MAIGLIGSVRERAGMLMSVSKRVVDVLRGDRRFQDQLYDTRSTQRQAIKMHMANGTPIAAAMIQLQGNPQEVLGRMRELRPENLYRPPALFGRRKS